MQQSASESPEAQILRPRTQRRGRTGLQGSSPSRRRRLGSGPGACGEIRPAAASSPSEARPGPTYSPSPGSQGVPSWAHAGVSYLGLRGAGAHQRCNLLRATSTPSSFHGTSDWTLFGILRLEWTVFRHAHTRGPLTRLYSRPALEPLIGQFSGIRPCILIVPYAPP